MAGALSGDADGCGHPPVVFGEAVEGSAPGGPVADVKGVLQHHQEHRVQQIVHRHIPESCLQLLYTQSPCH